MNRFVKWALLALPVLLGGAAIVVLVGYFYLRQSLPQTEGTAQLADLSAEVTVTRDTHGIPTIRAESLSDAYTALGYLHAQDRLWQMDFMRRTAEGRLSEVAGQGTVGLDRFMRILDLGDLAAEQVQHLDAETQTALEAYAAGVNAFIESDPVLPLEFQILDYAPETWTPQDSLTWLRLMALQLSGNYRAELTRAALSARLDAVQVDFLYPDGSSDQTTTLADAATGQALGALDRQLADLLPARLEPRDASNAWALQREDGRGALLANDPHLGLRAPGHWYLARIETPERTLVGATAPGVPFTIMGRNSDLAWGLTSTHSDTQDLFLEQVDPEDARRYRTPDGWARFETSTETIQVAESDPVELTVRQTRHGPVISDAVQAARTLAGTNQVVALAWPALRADDTTPQALYKVNAAKTVDGALEAMRDANAPQQNLFLADSAGNVGLIAAARVPIRKAGDGTLPRPGWTGEYDWTGMIPYADLPHARNPERGRLVNANNRLVDDAYPYLIAAHWPPPWRAERIERLLDQAEGSVDIAAMERILLDTRSTKAEMLLDTLLSYPPQNSRQEAAHQLLSGWDRHMNYAEAAPLVFTAWIDNLNRALFEDELAGSFRRFSRPDPRLILRALEEQSAWCDDTDTPDRTETCTEQVTSALDTAIDQLNDRFGEADGWQWGDAHVARFPHPLFSRIPVLNGLFTPQIGTPGGDETVNRGGSDYDAPADRRYSHIHGPTLRMVHDLSKPPESSVFMLSDGQSGNPLSPHFGGLAEAWRDGEFLKLVGGEQEDAERLRLTPGNS
ncbi:penicillin acylase family protein [Rhodovibrio salinarum]|uniref:Penicillin acylase family protein n=1 Tax=Rhodovibrio salinarum TaxID=1087 RepID=A0A934V0I0_9PROT|nr:penicillin acylase family protein [Rhodovibrio salinarum]MBK1697888.1 penicillin acylase family protein [Rhodovibrio salinarum]